MAKFKKGDKIYVDGPYDRAIYKVMDVFLEEGLYRLKIIDNRELPPRLKKPYREEIRVMDGLCDLLSDASPEWKKKEIPIEKLVGIGMFRKLP